MKELWEGRRGGNDGAKTSRQKGRKEGTKEGEMKKHKRELISLLRLDSCDYLMFKYVQAEILGRDLTPLISILYLSN